MIWTKTTKWTIRRTKKRMSFLTSLMQKWMKMNLSYHAELIALEWHRKLFLHSWAKFNVSRHLILTDEHWIRTLFLVFSLYYVQLFLLEAQWTRTNVRVGYLCPPCPPDLNQYYELCKTEINIKMITSTVKIFS